jgi:Carboxypeptidase regulatory-like domain
VAATIGRGAWAILVPSSAISGKITLPLEPGVVRPGDPVEGVRIILDAGAGAREHMPTAVTDARGRYVFEKVPPGTYTVRRIAPPGYIDACNGPEQITVQGSDVRDLDFHYRFSPELARATGPYGWAADLNTLPGRQPGQPIAGREEEEEPAPRRAGKSAPRAKVLISAK